MQSEKALNIHDAVDKGELSEMKDLLATSFKWNVNDSLVLEKIDVSVLMVQRGKFL